MPAAAAARARAISARYQTQPAIPVGPISNGSACFLPNKVMPGSRPETSVSTLGSSLMRSSAARLSRIAISSSLPRSQNSNSALVRRRRAIRRRSSILSASRVRSLMRPPGTDHRRCDPCEKEHAAGRGARIMHWLAAVRRFADGRIGTMTASSVKADAGNNDQIAKCRECGDGPGAVENIFPPACPITPAVIQLSFMFGHPLCQGKNTRAGGVQQGAPFLTWPSFARRAIARRGRCGPQR